MHNSSYYRAGLMLAATLSLLCISACSLLPKKTNKAVTEKSYQISEEDQKLLDSFKGLFHLPQTNPARYTLNEIATRNTWRAFKLLRGQWPGSDADRTEARKYLVDLRSRIQTGLDWPIKESPRFAIPQTQEAPKIDGSLDDVAWKNALTFHGQYLIDTTDKIDDGSIWKFMWSKTHLYCGVTFPDNKIIGNKTPYAGDSVEFFVMPSKKMRKYWEVVVGCDGNVFDGLQNTHKWGGFSPDAEAEIVGLKTRAEIRDGSFTVEIAIPFSEIPNYMLGNPPTIGQTLYFAFVRMQKNDPEKEPTPYTPFPMLYGGHNIFGYAIGSLSPPNAAGRK